MNIVCLFGILLIATETNGFAEASQRKGELQQRILLRKLRSFQRNDETNTESVTWNEILADVLVTKLNIFSSNNHVVKSNKNVATTFLSEILVVYKKIYDKYYTQKPINHNVINIIEAKPEEEVEVMHPDLKKESCENCDPVVEKDVECAEGFVLDKDGDCVPAPSKLILAVPNQCPRGYRADRLGFCRISF